MRRIALALALGCSLVGTARVASAAPGAVVGQPAPAFSLKTLDGKSVSLATYRGQTIVLNVWGSWCPPCRLEQPDLNRTARTLAREHVVILGIDTTETAETVRAFVAAKNIPYAEVATTTASPFARDYDIRNYPTTIVIDPSGIVRAVHADNVLPPAQLHAYIEAARQGRTAPLASAEQRRLDALLAPARYPFTGDPAAIVASVREAATAIAKADNELDDAMIDPARDHDLLRTRTEQRILRDVALAALTPIATVPADRALLARLQGDQRADRGEWANANEAYGNALAIDPKDTRALSGRAYVASKLDDYATVVAADEAIAELAPSTGSFEALGRAQARAGKRAESYASFDKAATLATSDSSLAHLSLYAARSALLFGDRARAKALFTRAGIAAQRIPENDLQRTLFLEQAQEGAIALGLMHGAQAQISLAPWTGPDLPGSLASTAKYRLVVVGTPQASVTMLADGLPNGWIASFCSDKICSPFQSTIRVPADGVKIVELQIVPRGAERRIVSVRVRATSGGKAVGTVATTVAI